jgi:hypothetical protein
MTRDSKNILTLLFFVLLTTGLNAKPRSVYLDKELKEALLTEYVEIVNYTDTTIIFKTIDSNKVLTAKIRGAVVQGQKFDKHTNKITIIDFGLLNLLAALLCFTLKNLQ